MLRCLVKLDCFLVTAHLMFDAVGRVSTMGVRKGGLLCTPHLLTLIAYIKFITFANKIKCFGMHFAC